MMEQDHLLSDRIIDEGIKYAKIYGAAAPGVMPKDTIKIKDENNFSIETPDRENFSMLFKHLKFLSIDEILECHKKVKEEI